MAKSCTQLPLSQPVNDLFSQERSAADLLRHADDHASKLQAAMQLDIQALGSLHTTPSVSGFTKRQTLSISVDERQALVNRWSNQRAATVLSLLPYRLTHRSMASISACRSIAPCLVLERSLGARAGIDAELWQSLPFTAEVYPDLPMASSWQGLAEATMNKCANEKLHVRCMLWSPDSICRE